MLFRQAIQLPFINGNDSRMIPNTFEAYQIEAEPSNIFRLNLGYVAGMKARTRPILNRCRKLPVRRESTGP